MKIASLSSDLIETKLWVEIIASNHEMSYK